MPHIIKSKGGFEVGDVVVFTDDHCVFVGYKMGRWIAKGVVTGVEFETDGRDYVYFNRETREFEQNLVQVDFGNGPHFVHHANIERYNPEKHGKRWYNHAEVFGNRMIELEAERDEILEKIRLESKAWAEYAQTLDYNQLFACVELWKRQKEEKTRAEA